ncbi:hypothetical protein CEXT_196831 [Caerostris extrusa]|uniref:Uncharacterized protein n=1 Tax=Caerostris extrusa TaxID=172846 RepID=A0AAV4Y9W2_CAEEX|nr:hypothetical protein CEXT_196831 [Caerostris extrusa]
MVSIIFRKLSTVTAANLGIIAEHVSLGTIAAHKWHVVVCGYFRYISIVIVGINVPFNLFLNLKWNFSTVGVAIPQPSNSIALNVRLGLSCSSTDIQT